MSRLPCGGVLQVLLVRDLPRTRLAKPAELRGGACRFKPLGGVAVSGLMATLWLPTSAALVGHRGLFSWPRGVFHEPAVSALRICPPALYVCVLSQLLSSGFLEHAYRDQTPSIMVPQLREPRTQRWASCGRVSHVPEQGASGEGLLGFRTSATGVGRPGWFSTPHERVEGDGKRLR